MRDNAKTSKIVQLGGGSITDYSSGGNQTEVCVCVCVCVFVCARVCVCLFRLEAWRGQYCSRKADPFRGPKLGSCLTLGSELSEETHVLTKQEILLGKGARAESSRVREPGRTALPHGLQSRVLW